MHTAIAGIEYYLPEKTLTTEELSRLFPAWNVFEIDRKTGIRCRHIAEDNQCASDLGVLAATKLFESGACSAADIDFLLFCTQSPDYALPATACVVQDRLRLSTKCGALDFNLGCSGYVYGLGLANGLIVSGQARAVLLITADTMSRYLDPADRNSRVIFGDGAAATVLVATSDDQKGIGPFHYATDGRGAGSIIVPNSGARALSAHSMSFPESNIRPKDQDRRSGFLVMDGPDVFKFAVTDVPAITRALLERTGLCSDDIKLFVFHQAHAYILAEIGRVLNLPPEKIQITVDHCGNTVSSTIPVALKHASLDGKIEDGDKLMLVGFGVGYSIAATIVRWTQIL